MNRLVLLLVAAPLVFAQQAKTINLTARANPWTFSPATFSVNAGDIVTLNISVAAADASADGHGFLMDTYVPGGVTVPRGQTKSVTFTATTPGTFAFVCTVASCGIGHGSMFGQMVVNGASAVSVSDVVPSTGPNSGGTSVSIFGTGFQVGATVTFGGLEARSVTVVSSSTITAVTPMGPASEEVGIPVDVIVRNPDGATATKARAFAYTLAPLSVSAITPQSGTAGATVTISGTGFSSAVTSSVTFGGVAATNVRVVDAVTMTATVPPHADGSVDVVVRIGTNSVTKPAAFAYVDAAPRRRAVRH